MHRITHIDTTKGILTLGMLACHIFIFFCNNTIYTHVFNLVTGLVSFSGFLFCFGYAAFLAYFSKTTLPKTKMYSNAFKLLLAFYISGAAHTYIVDNIYTADALIDIFLLNSLPGFSEFLASFAALMFFVALFSDLIKKIIAHQTYFYLCIALCLSVTLFKFSTNTVQLSILIGDAKTPNFAIVQYFPLFILGMYFAKHKILLSRKLMLYTGIFLAIFTVNCYLHSLPRRSSPDTLWILSSFAATYAYYVLAIYLDKIAYLNTFLRNIGRNVLFWLLSSNLFIFLLSLKIKTNILSINESLLAVMVIGSIIYFLSTIIHQNTYTKITPTEKLDNFT